MSAPTVGINMLSANYISLFFCFFFNETVHLCISPRPILLPGQQVAEHKNVQWARKLKCMLDLASCLGKQLEQNPYMPGSKDVRSFNRRTMAPYSVPDKVQQLVLNVKEHLPSTKCGSDPPPNWTQANSAALMQFPPPPPPTLIIAFT